MKRNKILLFALLISIRCFTQTSTEESSKMEWWREARFGMFIHWGVYAVPAGVYEGHEQVRGGAEWIMNRMKIPVVRYREYAKEFNPVKFDADAWVKMAKDAGMKYIVFTTKHHDGFAMYKTGASKWNIVDATPFGKDVLKKLSIACKKQGIKLGFYYSQAQDWIHPGGSVSYRSASYGWANPDSSRIDAYAKEHLGHWDSLQTTSTMAEYIDNVAVPQVRELLTNYGDVAVLWWDTPNGMTTEFAEKLQPLLGLQPKMITNDRLKRQGYPGDFKTPEQKIPKLEELDGKDWETCMTMNGTWGVSTTDHNWKSSETLIRNLIDITSKGGNYLLNVGPKADGEFPQESIDRLKEIGIWMKKNGESIYGTQASPLKPISWGRCTQKNDGNNTILYLSVFNWPTDGNLIVPDLKNRVLSAVLLSNGKKIQTTVFENGIKIQLPTAAPDNIASVIKIIVNGKVEKN